jgi:NADH:ubiquinone oxidoreductase subunit 6 (subunit J)
MEEDHFTLALSEWLNNKIMPFRTIPLILLAPNLLGHKLGHIATALPALFSFLIILGLTIKKRSGSTLYALAACLLFCAIPGLSDLKYGLGAYWLDLVAALFVGGAALCLLNSSEARNAKWLVAFSLFASLACLSRYIALAYLLIICSPIALLFLLRRFHREKSIKNSLLNPLIYLCVPFLILSGYFLISGFPSTYYYYTVKGWDYANPPLDSLVSMVRFLGSSFFGWSFTTLLVIICSINLVLGKNHIRKSTLDLLISFWYLAAVPIFLMLLGSKAAVHVTVYAVPLWFSVAVSPIAFPSNFLGQQLRYQKINKFLSSVILIVAFSILVTVTSKNYNLAINPSAEEQEIKQVDVELGRLLAYEQKEYGSLVWISFFDVRPVMSIAEGYFQFGEFVRLSTFSHPSSTVAKPHPREPIFAHRLAVWESRYPGLTPEELKRQVYRDTVRTIDVVVVYENPERIEEFSWLNVDPRTAIVAKYMAKRIPRDERWEHLSDLETERYGRLVLYRNLRRLNQDASQRPEVT